MADVSPGQTGIGARDRIDRAIARIEAATTARATDAAALTQRHDALRTRMAEAVAALDTILSRPDASVEDQD